MLTKNPDRRPSADQILSDPWIQNRSKPSALISNKVLRNLGIFATNNKLQVAILRFIYGHMILFKESFNLRQSFVNLDTHHKGKLKRDDLFTAYNNSGIEKLDFEAALIRSDSDADGFFNYEQFETAIISIKKGFCRQYLDNVFEKYAKTGSGKISISEIQTYFKNTEEFAEDKIFEDILKEADKNEDGELGLEELKETLISSLYL